MSEVSEVDVEEVHLAVRRIGEGVAEPLRKYQGAMARVATAFSEAYAGALEAQRVRDRRVLDAMAKVRP